MSSTSSAPGDPVTMARSNVAAKRRYIGAHAPPRWVRSIRDRAPSSHAGDTTVHAERSQQRDYFQRNRGCSLGHLAHGAKRGNPATMKMRTSSLAVCVGFSTLILAACLSDGKDDDDDDSSGSSGSSVGADSSSECESCTESNCSSEQATCDSTSGCGDAIDCLLGCDATDVNCKLACADQGGGLSNDALMAGNQLQTCLAMSCLSPCWTPAGGGSSSGSSNGGGSGNGGSGQTAFGSAACDDCASSSCASERSACDSASGCSSVIECVTGCDPGDSTCAAGCSAAADSLDAAAQQASTSYGACLILSCSSQCIGTSLGGAVPTTSESTGGGTTSPTSSASTFPSATTTTDPSSGSSGVATGTNWLSFDGDWADLSESPNADLNISGAMYAYGDSCATVDWDPATRCVSGEICDPGADFANWGVAVAFDFHNTGEDGSPPNAKLTWDPAEVGAVGVAWRISGSAPGLQAWITNMAPSHGGTCTVDACEIDGPGDGTSLASNSDQLYFDSLEKDYWGGSGTSYTFDPSEILSLQFKLPAVETGATSYSFCVDQIGIIR